MLHVSTGCRLKGTERSRESNGCLPCLVRCERLPNLHLTTNVSGEGNMGRNAHYWRKPALPGRLSRSCQKRFPARGSQCTEEAAPAGAVLFLPTHKCGGIQERSI